MTRQVQHRRGTTAQHSTFTGALAEITVDTSKKTAVVHDGVTPGGWPLALENSSVANGLAATRTILKAMDPSGIPTAYLMESGREGRFVWRAGDYSTNVATDTLEGIYIKADSVAASIGAWVRADKDYVNVKWFGAVGDGTANDTTAFQKALDVVKLMGGGILFLPSGTYKITSTLTYTNTVAGNKEVTIEGGGMVSTIVAFYGTGTCFDFQLGANTSSLAGTTNKFTARRFTIVSKTGHGASNGAAISVRHLASPYVTPGDTFEDIYIKQDDSTSWAFGIYTTNSKEQWYTRCYIMLFGSASDTCVFLDNSTTQASYGAFFTDCSFNGAVQGIRTYGWIETVVVENCLIVGQTISINLDGSAVSFGCPHFSISGSHINGKTQSIKTNKWRAIFISHTDVYSGVGSGDTAGQNILITNASGVQINGCKIEIGAPANSRTGIYLSGVEEFSITGNVIKNVSATGIVVTDANTKKGVITGNMIAGYNDGTLNDSGVFVANNVDAFGSFVINSNVIHYFTNGIQSIGPYTMVDGNVIRGCTTGVINSGTGSVSGTNLNA